MFVVNYKVMYRKYKCTDPSNTIHIILPHSDLLSKPVGWAEVVALFSVKSTHPATQPSTYIILTQKNFSLGPENFLVLKKFGFGKNLGPEKNLG